MSPIDPFPPQHPVLACVAAIEVAARELVDAPAWGLPDADLRAAVEGLEAARRRQDAALLSLMRELDSRGAAVEVGAADTAAWLRHRLGMAPGAARARVRLAAASGPGDELEPVRAALSDAEITVEHGAVIERALGRLPSTVSVEDRGRGRDLLLEQARVLDPHDLRRAGRHLLHVLAPHEALADEEQALERRELFLVDAGDGTVALAGSLDPVGAETLRTALDAAAAPPRAAEDPDALACTPARRRADALIALAEHYLRTADLPAVREQRPRVTVTTTLDALRHDVAAARQPAGRDAARSGGGRLTWGSPVTAATARALACDAEVIPAVLGTAGEVLDLGRSARTVNRAMRRALEIRDRGCVFPGCDRPNAWTDAHHGVHWADGGATSVANCALFCSRHHHGPLHHGWRLHIGEDDGLPYVIPPRWIDPRQSPRLHARFSMPTAA